MRRTKISTICTAIAVMFAMTSCNKETNDNQEISVFECVYTDTEGQTRAFSELLYWMDREDFSPNAYTEGGRIWVKGSEDIKNIRKGIEESIAECNEKIKGYGAFSYRDYSPVWKTDLETKGESKTLDSIEVSSEELQKLVEQLSGICRKYPRSGIPEQIIQVLFKLLDKKFKPVTVERILVYSCELIVCEYSMPRSHLHFNLKEHSNCIMEIADAVFEFCIAKYLADS